MTSDVLKGLVVCLTVFLYVFGCEWRILGRWNKGDLAFR